jgi:hypothetical protein
MRYDIFTFAPRQGNYGSNWKTYVQSVTKANMQNIVSALERSGDKVSVYTHGKSIGRFVYETPVTPNVRIYD